MINNYTKEFELIQSKTTEYREERFNEIKMMSSSRRLATVHYYLDGLEKEGSPNEWSQDFQKLYKLILWINEYERINPSSGEDLIPLELLIKKGKDQPPKALLDFFGNPLERREAYGINDFLNTKFPPRKMLISPILPEKGLLMLYAAKGIGKTWISTEMAYTVSGGSSMFGDKWKCEKPKKVLYVDGEMPASTLQKRFKSVVDNRSSEYYPTNEHLKILCSDTYEYGIPDLSTRKGQEFIEESLEDIKLLILDNISSLCNSGNENDSESWMPMQNWLLSLKRRGISVVFISHAGKSGNQRGNSKKEDLLDTVVSLKRPKDYQTGEGARFEVHYEKTRGFYGQEATPFEVQKKGNFWTSKPLVQEDITDQIFQFKKEGRTQRSIAEELGISPAKVNRTLKRDQE